MTQCDHTRRAAFIIPILIVALLGLVAGAQAGISVDIGKSRATYEKFLAETENLSPEAAARLAGHVEQTTGSRILDKWELPGGTVLDYYQVGNQAKDGPAAAYTGSAVLVHRESAMGQAYLRKLNKGAGVIERVNRWFTDVFSPNSHMVLVPVGMLGPGMTHDMVSAMAGATETRRVAVVGAEFPPWTDHSPEHDVTHGGRTYSNSSRYLTASEASNPGLRLTSLSEQQLRAYPMFWNLDTDFNLLVDATEAATPAEWEPDEYADSPGGPIGQSGAYYRPMGIHGIEWHGDANDIMPASKQWYTIEHSNQVWTEFDLQNDWWNLLFNRANTNSMSNYYYDNSHGNITIEGDRSDVFGWVRSGHVMDRHEYQYNWLHAIQPGTPIIRPFHVISTDDELDQRIVRASLDDNGLTVLMAEDTPLGEPVLFVWQADLDATVTGNQSGLTRVYGPSGVWSSSSIHHQDPYDNRRHKYINNGWTFRQKASGSPGYSYVTISWTAAEGTSFYFVVSGHANGAGYSYYRWGNPGAPDPTVYDAYAATTIANWDNAYPATTPLAQEYVPDYMGGSARQSVYRTVRAGSAQLYNTTFTTEDIYATNAAFTDRTAFANPVPYDALQAWRADEGGLGTTGDPAQKLFGSYETGTLDYGLGNRLKCFWYYCHSYDWNYSQRGYQLSGLHNAFGNRDDIGGTVEYQGLRAPRPYPINTGGDDGPNMGFGFGYGAAGHDADAMVADVRKAMLDNGININSMGYNSIAYLFPSGGTPDSEGAMDPYQGGGMRMMPRCAGYVLLPEKSGLALTAHEFGHCLFGFTDLYDHDLYNNSMTVFPPDPEFKQCLALGPYSVMTKDCSGVRVDAWHKLLHPAEEVAGTGWVDEMVVIRDQLNMEVPMIENALRNPVILKLPANPYAYLKLWDAVDDGTLNPDDTDDVRGFCRDTGTNPEWQEYFLVENRNRTGASYYGDVSPQGLYIYHIDSRNIHYATRQVEPQGFQVEERALSVAMVQADGMNDLETYTIPDNAGTATYNEPPAISTYTEGDPFPGADEVRSFSQIPTRLTRDVGAFVGTRWSPTSWSHGDVITSGPIGTTVIEAGTPTDSFSRVVNISDPGPTMTADVFVAPREAVVTNVSAEADIADDLTAGTNLTQGDQLQGMLAIKLDNPQYVVGSGDYSKMSTGEVVINTIRVLESGTAEQPAIPQSGAIPPHPAVERAYIYAETTYPANGFDPAEDSRIGSAEFGNTRQPDLVTFTSLGYRIPPDDHRVLYVVYDIREDATTTPAITVGAELTDYTFIIPAAPGAIAVRQRLGGEWEFGSYYFPIVSATSPIIEAPDKLEVHPNPVTPGAGAVAPAQVSQGQQNVELMQLRLHSTKDETIIRSMRVDAAVGTDFVNGVTDLNVLRAYKDENRNGVIDTSDPLLAESSFSLVDQGTPAERPQALLDLGDLNPISLRTVEYAEQPEDDVYWLLSVDIGAAAPIGKQVQLRVEEAAYVTLVTNPGFPDNDEVSPLNFTQDDAEPPNALPDTLVVSSLSTVITPNAAPNPPVDGWEPPNDASISDTTPRFRWNAATDNPTDPTDPSTADDPGVLYYEFELATDAAMTDIIRNGNTQAALGTTQFTLPDAEALPEPPPEGTDYYWHIRTVDTEGARSVASATLHFRLIGNQAPTAPAGGFWPSGGIAITDNTPEYRWNHGTDPDSNDTFETLLYRQQIDDNPDFSSPLVDIDDIEVPPGTEITDPVLFNPYDPPNSAPELQIGVIYYWRVMTKDVQQTYSENWSATQTFEVVENRAPYAPIAAFDPSGGEEVGSVRPTISWNTANPPDPDTQSDVLDTIDFYIDVKDDANLDAGPYITQMHRQIAPGELAPGERTVAMTVDVDLLDNEQYWYRIRARDLDGTGLYSDWSATQTFYVNLQNDPPEPPKSGFSPNNGVTVSDATTTCRWDYAEDPDPTDDYSNIHYIVQWSPVGTSHADFEAALAYQVTTNDGVNYGTAPEALADLQTWFWRVCSVDDSGAQSDWSAIQEYYLDTDNEAPELSNPTVSPYYGGLSTFFEYQVTYTDAENDPPGTVSLVIDEGLPGEQTILMAKVNPADNTYTDGVIYAVGVTGNDIGYGRHTYVFETANQARSLTEPDTHIGPTVGYKDVTQLWFKDQNWDDVGEDTVPTATRYEEGDTVYIELYDIDEDVNPAEAEQVAVVVYDQARTDIEPVTLVETGVNTGWFRGSIPTLGAVGQSDNGVLNVVASAGVQIAVTYQDKDDFNNPYPDNPDPDLRTDTAVVEDTIGPEPITPAPGVTAAVLTATSGVHGRTATLDWTDYDEPGQIDLQAYHIYKSASNFAGTGDAGVQLHAIAAAGTFSIVVDGLEPATDYYFAVVPVDERPNPTPGNTAVTAIHLLTADITPPTISNQVPDDGDDEQEFDTQIRFRLSDPGTGLDIGSPLTVTLDGADISADVDLTAVDGDFIVDCVYTPPQPFDWNDAPVVGVKIADKAGNLLDMQYTFAVLADVTDPQVTQLQPADGATAVGVGSTLSWHLTDEKSGIDLTTLNVEFQGDDITADVATTQVNGTKDIRCVYTPDPALLYNSIYTVTITIADVAGNSPAATTWTFETEVDNTGVTIDRFVPQRTATGVAVDTNISMRMTDTEAGVNADSIQVTVTVDGTVVAGTLTKTVQGSSVTVEFNPEADFAHDTQVFVDVSVEDNVGNPEAQTYWFRTAPPETYVISGRILTAAQAPVVGARINWNGNPADDVYSDGNGAFLITGAVEVPGGYDITPTKDEWTFTPATQNVYVGPDDVGGVDFTGALRTYAIRGTVADRSGAGLSGVTIAYGNSSVQSGANGTYEITGLVKGQYTLTPSKQYYHFEPVNRVVDVAAVAAADVEGVDFTAIADTFSISGTIYDSSGSRVEGVEVSDGTNVAITSSAGRYTLTNVAMGTHAVSARKLGYSIEPSVRQVTVPPNATEQDFTAYLELSNSFAAGINMIGVPGTPVDTNPMAVFGTTQVYRWDPSANPAGYLAATQYGDTSFMQVKPGAGFWVRFGGAATVAFAAEPTTTAAAVSFGIGRGWNMVANPYASPTMFANFQPTVAGATEAYAYVYNAATGSYELITYKDAINAARKYLLPWEGAWVLCSSGGTSLTVTSSASVSAADGEAETADISGGYIIPVVAAANGMTDELSLAGVVPGAGAEHTLANPPAPPAGVDVYFVNDGGETLARDVRTASTGSETFKFVVNCGVGDADVTVALPDLSSVPARYDVMLTDLEANKTVYARTMQSYVYHAAADNPVRHFELTVAPRSTASLTVTTASASQQAQGVVISYNVSQACRVNMTVRNMAGRCIKVLSADGTATAGLNSAVWSLRSDSGAMVPSGSYLVQIEATTESGQRAQALTRVNVNR